MASHQQGMSKTGLTSARVKDLDVAAPRPKLPPRALPDDVRAKLGLAPSAAAGADGAAAASATGGTSGAASGGGEQQQQQSQR